MIFGENRKKEKHGKIWHFRVPTPQRKATPLHGFPSPRRGRGAKMEPPRVRYSVALLLCSGALYPRVDTVHSEQIFGFSFLKV